MGTFIVKATQVSQGGLPYTNVPGPASSTWQGDAPATDAFQAFKQTPISLIAVGPLVDTLRFVFFGNCIYLDGAIIPISFFGLPAGFHLLDAQISTTIPLNAINPASKVFFQWDVQTELSVNGPFIAGNPATTMLQLLNNGMGVRVNLQGSDSAGIFGEANVFFVTGNYDIQQFSYTVSFPYVGPTKQVQIKQTNTGPGVPLDIHQITAININYIDGIGNPQTIPVPTWTYYLLTLFFIFPEFLNADEPEFVELTIQSTQFNGTVSLGLMPTIFFTAGSGIYQLVPGKNNDTVYISGSGGDIIDVPIPDPFGKTGFIGG